ncbi:hypothetical protein [Falsiroseomonas sp.]|uniref:hypothetical protein n=1 Tax=Falsiroseomonas sp. TaxID=2870721 RepID=UPI0027160E7C|nr:hypothetical protein [Falsiroseomonas sp.]MDO9501596.1 hypothetical protein [Falsiroseomonas sp.]
MARELDPAGCRNGMTLPQNASFGKARDGSAMDDPQAASLPRDYGRADHCDKVINP